MKLSTATVIAFISFTNASPTPQYGWNYGNQNPTPAVPSKCEICTGNGGTPAGMSAPYKSSQPAQPAGGDGDSNAAPKVPDTSVLLNGPVYPTPSGGAGGGVGDSIGGIVGVNGSIDGGLHGNIGGSLGGYFGAGLDLGSLISAFLGGGKIPGLGGHIGGVGGDVSGGINGDFNLNGFFGGLIRRLNGSGFLDSSGHINIGSVFDGLKGVLSSLPGGSELSTVCDQFKDALSGPGKIDFRAVLGEFRALLNGSGKIDLDTSLGIDVDVLIRGLNLLFEGSLNGSTGLDIGVVLDGFEGFLGAHGVLDLGASVGLDLSGSIDQLKGFLSANGSIQLDISGMLGALKGLLKGEVDLSGFIATCGKLPGGKLLVSIWGQINAYFGKLSIETNAIFGQITNLLSGLVKGAVYIGGNFLGNGHLDLSALLGALGQIGGNNGSGGHVGSNGHVGGGLNIVKWFGRLLSGNN